MRKILKVFLLIALLIPLNCFALTKYEENGIDIEYQVDNSYWTEKDLNKERIYVNRKWSSDCGMIITSLGDLYGNLSEEDLKSIANDLGQSSISREYYNYNNFFDTKETAKLFIDTAFQSNGYDIEDVEYYNVNNIKYINYTGTVNQSGITLDIEGYLTLNNGYLFSISYMRSNLVNTTSCESTIRDIVNTSHIKSNTNESDDLLIIILVGIPLTALCYMIVPFIFVKVLKKKYNKKQAKKLALWNSIIVGLLFLVITVIIYGPTSTWNAGPALLYYMINSSLWVYKGKEKKQDNNKEDKVTTSKETTEVIKSSRTTSNEELYKDAVNLYQLKDYTNSIKRFKEYIELVLNSNKDIKNWTSCNNILEFYIYCNIVNPKEELTDINTNINNAYLYLGMMEYEKGNNEEAIVLLNEGLKYSPADIKIMFEKAENYKAIHDMKEFFNTTNTIYKYLYTKLDLAKYYRNLGYYYIEKKEYDLAKVLYLYSLRFDNNPIVNKELEYIISKSDDTLPAKNRLENILSKNNIPLFIDENVIDVILKLDKEIKKTNNANSELGKLIKKIKNELQI